MTLWKTIGDFSFSYFEPTTDASEFGPFASLVSLWQSKRLGRTVPAWSDFDFYDFEGWHGYLAVYDVTWNPFDYAIRLSGVQFDELLGRTMTGATREKIMEIAVEDRAADEFHEMASRRMFITHTKGVNIRGREHIKVEFLELPLSDDGQTTTHTIEAFVQSPG